MPRPDIIHRADLATFGELRLIERIRREVSRRSRAAGNVSIVEGIGDDAAILRCGKGRNLLLLTCDTLVEGIHFRKHTPFYRIGWKAMGCNLSDIAAMGGIPRFAVVSLACPARITVKEIDDLYAGMTELGDKFGVAVVGGDTVESPRALVVTVALVGEVEENSYVTRTGAKPGDVICVTGTLGGSLLGRHLDFVPRVDEGRFLALHCHPTAMIDLSDGLGSDLTKLVQASQTTAEIFTEAIPISDAAIRLARRQRIPPVRKALFDGEDFELLFTLRKEGADDCLRIFRKNFSTPVTAIGRVKRGRGRPVLIDKNGIALALEPEGYEHFRKKTR